MANKPPQTYPKNSLDRLQRMAAGGHATVGWERAIGPTSRRLDVTAERAQQYALETVSMLTQTDFVESVDQFGTWFDVYALYRDGLGWFVKVAEDENGLLLLSHHDPERGSITTAAGNLIEVIKPST